MALTDYRIKHLEFIQATIARQASHSFAVKGWSLTVAAAIYAYAAANRSWWLALVVLLPAAAFAWLDHCYLRQERLFRELYDDARSENTEVPVFSMKTECYGDHTKFPKCRRREVFKSSSWWALHSMILAVGLFLVGVAIVEHCRT